MRSVLSVLFLLGMLGTASAKETVTVSVNGLVCDFCARSLEKTFGAQASVESVSVDLDAKTVTIAIKDGQSLSDEVVKDAIKDAGFDLVAIERTNE